MSWTVSMVTGLSGCLIDSWHFCDSKNNFVLSRTRLPTCCKTAVLFLSGRWNLQNAQSFAQIHPSWEAGEIRECFDVSLCPWSEDSGTYDSLFMRILFHQLLPPFLLMMSLTLSGRILRKKTKTLCCLNSGISKTFKDIKF